MKLTYLFALSLGLSVAHATAGAVNTGNFTGTVWANGVSQADGWYDANKIDNSDGDADDYMCYAASASNLIAWWQNGGNVNTVPSTTPTELDDIWQTFLDNNLDYEEGGDTLASINWWISGVYAPETKEEWNRYFADESRENLPLTLAPFSGYYFDQYGLTKTDLEDFLADVWNIEESEESASVISLEFTELFNDGAGISLAIVSDETEMAHAITLWGAEYVNGNLAKLWLTDSDDYDTTVDPYLFSADVKIAYDDNGVEKIYFVDDDLYGEGTYIHSVYAIDSTLSQEWQLIPEPTTATLSLLALAGLAARRRRR